MSLGQVSTHTLVLITSLWTFNYTMIAFCSLLPQYHVSTDALKRLIDVVGLGWGGGEVGGVLITSLWTFIYMMISFCSLLPQYHMTQMLCILHSLISFHFISFHSFIHFILFIHSFIHSFSHSFSQPSKVACTAEEPVHNRANPSTCTDEQIPRAQPRLRPHYYAEGHSY